MLYAVGCGLLLLMAVDRNRTQQQREPLEAVADSSGSRSPPEPEVAVLGGSFPPQL